MADQFLGEIRPAGFNFAPTGWAFCNGQLMGISQNTALFALLGTQFGGDGRTTFALPNLQGATPLGQGQGPGLSPYAVGEAGGVASVTLLTSEIPAHNHGAVGTSAPGPLTSPQNAEFATPGGSRGATAYIAGAGNVTMAPEALSTVGGNQPHDNLPPYQALNFIIALVGIFPARP